MRAFNRFAGALLGVVLLAIGVLTVIETFAVTFWNRSWPLPVQQWRRDLTGTQWADGRFFWTAIIVFAVGLVILISQLWRVRPQHVDTVWNTGDETWELTRRSVEEQVADAARAVNGIDSVKASTTGSPRHWRLAVKATATDDAVHDGEVAQAVEAQMQQVGAPPNVPVRVDVRHVKSRT